MTSSTVPLNSENGPSLITTHIAALEAEVDLRAVAGRALDHVLGFFVCQRGVGFALPSTPSSTEMKLVTPGVFRTTYQLSSFMTIWTRR